MRCTHCKDIQIGVTMNTDNNQIFRSGANRNTALKGCLSLLALSALLLQTACVSNVSSQVKQADKDSSGAYNGVWIAQVQRSAGQQYMPNNWIANCDPSAHEFSMKVQDGVASVRHGGKVEETFVAGNGDFRFHIPLKQKAQASSGSSKSMLLSGMNRIIYGNFQKTKGRYTVGYEQFGNSGCTAVMNLVKKTKSS